MGGFKELVKKNRSYRGYDENYRFTKEQLEDYVDTTRYAASSVNMQPLKYYIAYEKENVDTVQKMTKWARALPQLDLPYEGKRPTGFIIICQDLNISENTNRFMKPLLIVALGKPDEEIVLTDVKENGDTNYYRDENDVHYVPKRSLEDILIK